ncbi:S8 family serine peptidase [Actinoplanes sp. NPDC051861]|uniref:S8 family serine peptidase n=1 Tax=Actinoplanes sp. NPDC051861 TaxID=3155170 RepID=UPI00343D9C0A
MRFRVAALLTVALIGVPVSPARAEPPPAAPVNQYYYTVKASHQGAPENLWEIASRFLGDTGRVGEILDLNAGRVQPGGGRLSDPSRLTAGWHLVLPWDAVGADLRHGPLPQNEAGAAACAWPTDIPATASWGQALLNPGGDRDGTSGSGVKVAVISSGVDGSAPELAGRVTPGADIVAGAGRGDLGCKSAGTGLAGIVAGDDGRGGSGFGVAPGARIVPIKAGAEPSAAIVTAGIGVATSAGAQVVLIGTGIDTTDPGVLAAVNDAISRDVVIVVPATSTAEAADGMLRVGAVGEDRSPAGDFAGDAADLLAPGVGVATIGQVVSGSEFAAAYVAGTVALVRSAHPGLHAADVTRRVLATAADGLVSPVTAVTSPVQPAPAATAAAPDNPMSTLSRVLTWLAAGLAVALLLSYLVKPSARALAGIAARRRDLRLAEQTRARLATDTDDPFWDAPAGGGRPAREHVTETIDLRGSPRSFS